MAKMLITHIFWTMMAMLIRTGSDDAFLIANT